MAPRIAELAAIVSTNTLAVSDHLESNGLPFPSFDIDGPLNLDIKSANVQHSRAVAIDALQELLELLQGPIVCMMPRWNSACLKAIHRFGLPEKVPLDGMISYQELAKSSGLHAGDLQQIIRHAISYNHLFAEPKVGFVAHSAGSKALVQDEVIRGWFGMQYDCLYAAFNKTVDALTEHKDKEPNHTAFSLAYETNDSLFEWLESHPETEKPFASMLTAFSRDTPGFSEAFLLHGYDWKSLGSATVVDVGGSNGYVSKALAREYPSLNIIVQDLPHVIEAVQNQAQNPGSSNTVTFQAHNFFTPQTVVADAYLFRWVMHDWPDHYVERAMKSLIPALRPGARVILNESLCPVPGSLPLSLERGVRTMDMDMLSLNNSRLRTVDEWQQIFKAADTRFSEVECSMPEGASLAIMEVIWQG